MKMMKNSMNVHAFFPEFFKVPRISQILYQNEAYATRNTNPQTIHTNSSWISRIEGKLSRSTNFQFHITSWILHQITRNLYQHSHHEKLYNSMHIKSWIKRFENVTSWSSNNGSGRFKCPKASKSLLSTLLTPLKLKLKLEMN
jgi:hypothetical protein